MSDKTSGMDLEGFVSFNESEHFDLWGWSGSIRTPDATVEFGPYRHRTTGKRLGPGVVVEKMQRWAASRGHGVMVQVFLGPVSTTPPEDVLR